MPCDISRADPSLHWWDRPLKGSDKVSRREHLWAGLVDNSSTGIHAYRPRSLPSKLKPLNPKAARGNQYLMPKPDQNPFEAKKVYPMPWLGKWIRFFPKWRCPNVLASGWRFYSQSHSLWSPSFLLSDYPPSASYAGIRSHSGNTQHVSTEYKQCLTRMVQKPSLSEP